MNYKEFDAGTYISNITKACKFAVENNFVFARFSGMSGLEEMASRMKKDIAFVALDETAESSFDIKEDGPFEKKIYTIFIVHRYKTANEEDRITQMKKCRVMAQRIFSRLLHDSNKLYNAMVYLDMDIQARELGDAILNSCTGLYFSFSFARPTDLSYQSEDWDQDIDIFDKAFNNS